MADESIAVVKKKWLKIRLEGGPDPDSYKVFDDETGEQIVNIVSINFETSASETNCTIQLFNDVIMTNVKTFAELTD